MTDAVALIHDEENITLQDVADQLEQERALQIDLQAQVDELVRRKADEKQQREDKRLTDTINSSDARQRRRTSFKADITEQEHHSLQTQVEGYKQLADALCQGRPAVAAAKRREYRQLPQQSTVLPAKVIRLLEIIPWHPVAQSHIDVKDAVYEWQRFDSAEKVWKGDMASFPSFFHALPITSSPHGDSNDQAEYIEDTEEGASATSNSTELNSKSADDTDDNYSIEELENQKQMENNEHEKSSTSITTTAPSFDFSNVLTGLLPSILKSGPHHELVLTNANLTHRFTVDAKTGFPLPNPKVSGTWKWIGRWTIEELQPETKVSNWISQNNLAAPNKRTIVNFFDKEDTSERTNKQSYQSTALKSNEALCDKDGWRYAREASHFVLWNSKDLCWGEEITQCDCLLVDLTSSSTISGQDKACSRCWYRRNPLLRRRKWTRQRVLVDYPLASDSTQEFLKLSAKNSDMMLATEQLQGRLLGINDNLNKVHGESKTTLKTNKCQLDHYQEKWEAREERIKVLRYGRFKRKIEELACKRDDILPIIANPEMFWHLQQALRQSGAITNAMLQQGIHFYIQDHVRKFALVSSTKPATATTGRPRSGSTAKVSSSKEVPSKMPHNHGGPHQLPIRTNLVVTPVVTA